MPDGKPFPDVSLEVWKSGLAKISFMQIGIRRVPHFGNPTWGRESGSEQAWIIGSAVIK